MAYLDNNGVLYLWSKIKSYVSSAVAGFSSDVKVYPVYPSDELPLMDGLPESGVSKLYSRSDHRHPSDSTKMNYISPITNIELEEMLV